MCYLPYPRQNIWLDRPRHRCTLDLSLLAHQTMTTLNLSYPAILTHFGRHLVAGRTESRAFVAWFLEHYLRLEETEAQDAVCDGPDDKGVDGIYVDENLERIDVFQAKLFQNPSKTLGDTALKEFVGTLDQFRSDTTLSTLAASTKNSELAKLIKEHDLPRLIRAGYSIRGVFITNAPADGNGQSYLASRDDVVLYDAAGLLRSYIHNQPTPPIAASRSFDITGYDYVEYRTPDAKAVVVPILASELVALDGIANGDLFAWNVRQSLGRTKVNKAIAESVKDQQEHKNFLLYHNGLTILCQSVSTGNDKVEISGYSVVNGCQSLTTLYENRAQVTQELRVLTRLIELAPDDPLAAKITRHSNNQNAINARDLQANSNIQRRLQREFAQVAHGAVFYEIKRGESTGAATVITNEDAARTLLAFDLEQPWACHQTYRLFDELHSDIFARPEVDAQRIIALHQLYDAVEAALPQLRSQLVAGYRLTRFFLLYVLKKALQKDVEGQQFARRPQDYAGQPNGLARIRTSVDAILRDLVIDLNAELEERDQSGIPFDYKRELKSPSASRAVMTAVVPMYEKAVTRGRASGFAAEWAASSGPPAV